jgi:hypothetical protein
MERPIMNAPKNIGRKRAKLSLAPLSFDEAVTDLLKVKPEPKKKPKQTKRATKARHELERRHGIMTYDHNGKQYKRIESFPTQKAASAFLREQENSGKDVAMWSEQNGKIAVGQRT